MFNIGDIVKLKTGLIPGTVYGDLVYLNSMNYYANKPLEIINITNTKNYVVKECGFIFSEEMLELYNERPKIPSITHNFEIGDIVTIRTDLIPNTLYQKIAFIDIMSKYKGHAFKIKSIIKSFSNTYILETLDGHSLWFTEEMFEEIPKTKENYNSSITCVKPLYLKNIITITEVIINPCKKETYTL